MPKRRAPPGLVGGNNGWERSGGLRSLAAVERKFLAQVTNPQAFVIASLARQNCETVVLRVRNCGFRGAWLACGGFICKTRESSRCTGNRLLVLESVTFLISPACSFEFLSLFFSSYWRPIHSLAAHRS
jgi:hypothetical protein